jgi:hypothetical protein
MLCYRRRRGTAEVDVSDAVNLTHHAFNRYGPGDCLVRNAVQK